MFDERDFEGRFFMQNYVVERVLEVLDGGGLLVLRRDETSMDGVYTGVQIIAALRILANWKKR